MHRKPGSSATESHAWVGWLVGCLTLGILIPLAIFFAPLSVAILTWVLLYNLVRRYDIAPYIYGRFIAALLIAWAVDGVLFRLSVKLIPESFRHLAPAIIVVSVFAGFHTWNMLPTKAARERESPKSEYLPAKVEPGPLRAYEPIEVEKHPFAGFVAFMIMLFAMSYVLMPLITHYMPQYRSFWTDVTQGLGGDEPP